MCGMHRPGQTPFKGNKQTNQARKPRRPQPNQTKPKINQQTLQVARQGLNLHALHNHGSRSSVNQHELPFSSFQSPASGNSTFCHALALKGSQRLNLQDLICGLSRTTLRSAPRTKTVETCKHRPLLLSSSLFSPYAV